MPIEAQGSGQHSPRPRDLRPPDSLTARPHYSVATTGYMTAAAAMAAALFFLLWWMLQGEETPWVPAGLAASVVILVAAFARLLTSRRARISTRNQAAHHSRDRSGRNSSGSAMKSTSLHAAALRALQKQSADADALDAPETHRELYELCAEYLAGAERALQSPSLQVDGRVALRAGQERVRDLQKHHLLTWARGSARALTYEAQQRVRLYEKVETANRALNCIDSALRIYPDEEDLYVSARAVKEFITSSRVAHWVELAERAAFKGHFERALDCYRDALYYLTRERPDAAGEDAAGRITREIELLRARLDIQGTLEAPRRSGKRKVPREL